MMRIYRVVGMNLFPRSTDTPQSVIPSLDGLIILRNKIYVVHLEENEGEVVVEE